MIQYLHNIFKILTFDSVSPNICKIFRKCLKIFQSISKYFDCTFPTGLALKFDNYSIFLNH